MYLLNPQTGRWIKSSGTVAATILKTHDPKTLRFSETKSRNLKIVPYNPKSLSSELHFSEEKCKILGSGTFGRVYLLESYPHNLAVKVFTDEDDLSLTFLREVNALLAFDHPNVLRPHSIHPKTITFPVYQTTLHTYIHFNSSRLSSAERVVILYQILLGLHHIFTRGYMHRDLKPDNILLNQKDTVYDIVIADLGLCRRTVSPRNELTGVVQTLWFRAPEVLREETYSFSADIWSYGLLVIYVLTGRMLSGNNEEHQLQLINEALSHKERWPLSEGERRLLDRILLWDPEKRATTTELLLDPYFSGVKGLHPSPKLVDDDFVIGVRCLSPTSGTHTAIYSDLILNSLTSRLTKGQTVDDGGRLILIDWMVFSCILHKIPRPIILQAIALLDNYLEKDSDPEEARIVAAACVSLTLDLADPHPRVGDSFLDNFETTKIDSYSQKIFETLVVTDPPHLGELAALILPTNFLVDRGRILRIAEYFILMALILSHPSEREAIVISSIYWAYLMESPLDQRSTRATTFWEELQLEEKDKNTIRIFTRDLLEKVQTCGLRVLSLKKWKIHFLETKPSIF